MSEEWRVESEELSENSEGSEGSENSESACSPQQEAIRFTLNDRYRFMRELFGGSAERMAATVSEVAAMGSADEIAGHLSGTLGWDLEEPAARDFFAAVSDRFNPRPTLLA